LVTHMGSHAKTSEQAGIDRFAQALNTIFEKTQGIGVKLLLENTAGSGSWLGYKFVHHKMIFDRVEHKERLGVCLDTAHAFAAGYDLKSKDGLEMLIAEIESLVGMDKVCVIHLNDSKKDFNTHLDHHENIGKGKIGPVALRQFIKHPKLKDKVFILETPRKDQKDDLANLAVVKKLAK